MSRFLVASTEEEGTGALTERNSLGEAADIPSPDGVEELLRRAVVTAGEGRQALVVALTSAGIDPAGVSELVMAVEPGHRAEAIRVLGKAWGPLSSRHLQPLLRDPSGSLRAAALGVLEVAPHDVPWLHDVLRDDLSAAVRVAAVRALAHASEPDRLSALATALGDPDSVVRLTATEMLPVASVSAARSLLAASQDPDPAVRRAAQRHLIRTPSWVLWMVLDQSSKADELLSLLEQEAPDCLLVLVVERMSSPEPKDRARALGLAGRLAAPGLTRMIEDAVRDTDGEVRRAAVAELSGRLEAVPMLVRALRDQDRNVRLAAVSALDGIEHDDAVTALIDVLHDRDDDVRRTTIEVLARRSSAGLARRLAQAMTAANCDAVTQVLKRLGPVGLAALDARKHDDAAAEHHSVNTTVEFSLLQALEEVARIRSEAAAQAQLSRAAVLKEAREEANRIRRDASAEIEQLQIEAERRRLEVLERPGRPASEELANGVSPNHESELSMPGAGS